MTTSDSNGLAHSDPPTIHNKSWNIVKEKRWRLVTLFIDTPWGAMFLAWLYLTWNQGQSLLWFDSGELALAGHSFGLAHPPGQPFYTFLSTLTFYLPSPLWWMNHLSVCSLSLTIYPLWHIEKWLRVTVKKQDQGEKNFWSRERYANLFKLLVSLSWVSIYPIWDQGTRIEVYSLANFLGVWSLWLLAKAEQQTKQQNCLWAGLSIGLCGSTHAIFALAYTLASSHFIVSFLSQRQWYKVLWYIVGMVSSFIIAHIYLFWAVLYSEGFVWGNWQSLEDIKRYFGGGDYVNNLHSWLNVPNNLNVYGAWLIELGCSFWLVCSLIGLIMSILHLKSKALLWWMLSLGLGCVVFPFTYQTYWPEVPDFSGYVLPWFSLSLLLVWILLDRVSFTIKSVLCIGIIVSLQLGQSSPLARQRSTHNLPIELAHNWLKALPSQAALFVQSDHWVFPLMYAQEIENIRPDILVFNTGFANSTWYWQWLHKRHPSMPTLEEIEQTKGSLSRLSTVALSRSSVYAESRDLALYLARGTPWMHTQPCSSSWGVSIACQTPLPLPTVDELRTYSKEAQHDPISEKVLARHGLHFVKQLWSEHKQAQGIKLGFACINKDFPQGINEKFPWWPVPEQVWHSAQHDLIGNAEILEILMFSLIGKP